MPSCSTTTQTVTSEVAVASGAAPEVTGSIAEVVKVTLTLHEENPPVADVDKEDDDERILETGNNGRWQKINHQVSRW